MGQFVSRIMSIFSGLQEKRLLLLGLDGAGKTSLLYKLLLDEMVYTMPTIGFNVERVQYKKMEMMIWDVGGQTRLRRLWRHHFLNTDALIYMIDSCDQHRLEEARDELFAVLNDPNMQSCGDFIIFLNKQDLPNALSPMAVVEKLGLKDGRGVHPLFTRRWRIQGCSALTGEGVFEGLDWLCNSICQKS